MKHTKRLLTLLPILLLLVALTAGAVSADSGYTQASDVSYTYFGSYVANWGYRGETCTFLSPMADAFYGNEYTIDDLVLLIGGNGIDDAPESELFAALQELMVENHTTQTSYGDTRYQYMYTDCQLSDTSTILSFYSGTALSSTWDQGKTWNREHVWPASKSLSGRPGNSSKGEGADIMMLRPAAKSENGSRSNKAYGESSDFYLPDESVRGDCARILLYTYVRWGNTTYMWGSIGVIESLDILLKWMEEDPVDTWEMGRNDAVESITGTRNVFVDYPELAWLLFGEEIPADMTTPSGYACRCIHDWSEATCLAPQTCTLCGLTQGSALGHRWSDATCTAPVTCALCGLTEGEANGHLFPLWQTVREATKGATGLQQRTCVYCGETESRTIDALQAAPADTASSKTVIILAGGAVIVIGGGVAVLFLLHRKKARRA